MPLEGLEEEGLPKNPDLQLMQWKFLVCSEEGEGVAREEAWGRLLEACKENAMAPFYQSLCSEAGRPPDPALLSQLRGANESELARLEEALKDARENLGDTEVRDALLAKAEYLTKIGDKDAAVSAFRQAYEKAVGLNYRLDIVFYQLRIGLFYMDHDLISRNIEKAKTLIEEGGDWDRRNRLKTYEALYAISVRDFKKAATCFFETMATFTSTELMDYRTFVKYAIFSCLLALERSDVKSKIINGTDLLEVLHDFPELKRHVHSLYYCHYDQFFQSLIWVEQEFKQDRYLSPHAHYYVREMRIHAYTQLLESYRSLSLQHMARSFGVSTEFIDRELSRFIASGRLHARIDKVGGVVETNRPDSKNFLYQSTIKQGDLLLNRVQKLSRVINT